MYECMYVQHVWQVISGIPCARYDIAVTGDD